ncbi:PKHD-type hydroxylase [Fluviicoccus keumensis]|uniref:PKHD-type hydroxylase n=1 Tax=Fluviicoccus keumensis TaxID=1435465 RepID=A0A4Q7YNS1_9GAMM|nr:Fe2+-dependent dioxygenase [Fluviicoccus keumensis]RZU38654.1 PKHD-type hydroxylase [Fluviicoccus keumensis]
MLTIIENILDAATVRRFRDGLDRADWEDGLRSAGSLAGTVKQNRQLPEDSATARELGNHILRVLGNHPLFLSAALPEKIYPPRFNRYRDQEHFGTHIDSAIMTFGPDRRTLRTDLSATLFLTDPADYDGGELTIETRYGAQAVKLAAGDLVLYPADSLHRVTPVTRGARVCAFFWIQSMVRDEGERTLLFDLDQSIQALTAAQTPPEALLPLTGIYHNLLRRWASV